MTTDIIPKTATEALRRWREGKSVFTVELGGLGPGYEQCIHIGVFEIVRSMNGRKPSSVKAFERVADKAITLADKKLGRWGFSGAQAGAAKQFAYNVLMNGWKAELDRYPKNRRIQVERGFPTDVK